MAAAERTPQFSCEVSRGPRWLELRYRVVNRDTRCLGLFNQIRTVALDSVVEFSPDTVYLDLAGDTARLLMCALTVPEGLMVGAYVPPNVLVVRPSDSFEETAFVPVPLKARNPYRTAMMSGQVVATRETSIRRVEVVLGVFPVLAEDSLLSEYPAYPDVKTLFPSGTAVERQILLSQVCELAPPAVPALDYESYPWSRKAPPNGGPRGPRP
jgi:hypothetical protein